MKMTFKAEISENSKIEINTEEVTLPEILQIFEQFLRGSGFYFNGTLDIVEYETAQEDFETWLNDINDSFEQINRHDVK